MERGIGFGILKKMSALAVCGGAIWMAVHMAGNIGQGEMLGGPEKLEEAVRRAAVACYSTEGSYPPDLEYLEERYGLKPDPRYIVHYSIFAENIPPDIVVTVR